MSENERLVNKIINDFEEKMGQFEARDLFASIYGKNRPTAQEIYTRQKQLDRVRFERREALKRVLWLNLGTEAEQKKMLEPAAEKAVDEAMKKVEKKLKNLTFDIDIEF